MRPARATESSRCGHSAAATPPTGAPERPRSRRETPRPPRSTVQLRERLVERRAGVAEAVDAGAVAEGAVERLAEGDAAVLDRVVLVHVQVAAARQLEVEQPVRGERREHVVEEADAGRDLGAPAAVEVDAHVDGRLARAARRRPATTPDGRRLRRRERRAPGGPAAPRAPPRADRSRAAWRSTRGSRPRAAARGRSCARPGPGRARPANTSLAAPGSADGHVVAGAADALQAEGRDPVGQALALGPDGGRVDAHVGRAARTPARPRARSATRSSPAGAARPGRRPGPGSRGRSRSGCRRGPSPWRRCARRRGSRAAR